MATVFLVITVVKLPRLPSKVISVNTGNQGDRIRFAAAPESNSAEVAHFTGFVVSVPTGDSYQVALNVAHLLGVVALRGLNFSHRTS